MGNMIDVLTDQMDNIASSAVESAPFDKSTHGRIIEVLDGNKYTVKLSDGTEKSVLSLTSDSFVKDDVVVVSALQNDPKNSYIIGKPGISKISVTGYGDMSKSTYDTDNDGIVDNAERVNGHTVLTDVPSGAVFTDTTYSDATTSVHGLMSSTDKTKLDGIAAGAEVNVNANWNATSGDAQILNLPSVFPPSEHTHSKSDITDFPAIPDQLSDLTDDSTHRVVTDAEKSSWDGKQSALSGDVSGHYHSTDRNRANHTGTQTASTISDFSSAALSAAPAETITSIGLLVNGATAKTSPVDADMIPLMDSADSNKIKKLSWAYVKSVLNTYFSSIFAPLTHKHTVNNISDLAVTATELNYTDGVTSNIQTQLNSKLPATSYVASDVLTKLKTVDGAGSGLDADKLDGKESSAFSLSGHTHTLSNIPEVTATAGEINILDGITATTTELNYIDGVTSNIQTQLNSKSPIASPTFTGTPTAPTANSGTNTTQIATTAFVQSALSSGGYGDMLKSVYDTNGNGIVDNAEKVSGFTVAKSVPANAVFTDTTYSNATTSKAGLESAADKTKLNALPKITLSSTQPSSPTNGDFWLHIL